MGFFRQLLPTYGISNIVVFYVLTICRNNMFIAGNWLFFYLTFMPFSLLGVIESAAFGVGFLTEIPSGAIADRFGRKITLIISMLISAVGGVTIGLSSSWVGVLIGLVTMNIGWSLYSGCAEAFAYDSLVDHKKSDQYDVVLSRGLLLATITFAITSLIGGWLYVMDIRLPHVLWGAFYLLGAFVVLFAKEPHSQKSEVFIESPHFFHFVRQGISILSHSKVRHVLVFIILTQCIYFMYSEGFLQPAMGIYFGFNSTTQSIIFAAITMCAGVAAIALPHFRRRIKDSYGLVLLCLFFGVVLVVSAFPLYHHGALSLLFLSVIGNLSLPLTSIFINTHAAPESRATALSAVSFISKCPYAILAIGMGFIIEYYSVSTILFILGAVCVIPSTVFLL